ncbi:uncharacterized protein LOC144476592 [Augochlora pura]
MKLAILLLLGCCAVALAIPNGSAEDSENSPQTTTPSNTSTQTGEPLALTVLIDRIIKVVAKALGVSGINGGADLLTALTNNPIGRMVWSIVQPIVSNVNELESVTMTVISWIRYMISFLIPSSILALLQTIYNLVTYIFTITNRALIAGVKFVI